MAYSESLHHGLDRDPRRVSVGLRIVRWLGALSSIALVGGLSFWTYDLATRDARSVPVVLAMEGPSREQPEDPGGFQAAHQGLSVNRIASDTIDAPIAERVILAPEPMGVTEEDQPQPELLEAVAAPEVPLDPDAALRLAVEGALTQVFGSEDMAEDDGMFEMQTVPRDLSGSVRGAGIGPRPRPRPAMDIATRATANPEVASFAAQAPAVALDLSPADIPAGTRLVQLGAFDSEAEARQGWIELSIAFEDYLGPKRRVIERAEVGDNVFYRLRAYGFADLIEARSFCAVLIADHADCIPVLTR
ncbi:SPOR domain-containing protein [Pseudoruegeria sp. SK021]|uniref:SPOR domain-containing protein n=1 Tax=Pseudoruegeria sp. SK021 TaxID=1933035 RepID=UPI000A25D136|nr:SPOR domain-containing protein [Pseudoruegeria sp. SK021]OSP55441.1 hypothetical protein BV911_07275 [Pseudoruegeria sp. SK021]